MLRRPLRVRFGLRHPTRPDPVPLGIGLALGVAVAVRWLATWHWYRTLPLGPTDNFFYHQQANLLADGKGFVNPFAWLAGELVPTAAHPPLYSLYLAAWSLVGVDTPLGHRLVSGLVSAAAVIPVAFLARRLAGDRAALVAAFAAAVTPALWLNDGLILSESLYVTLAALALWQAHRVADDPGIGPVLVLSAILAAGALTRSEALLAYPVLLVPLVLTRPHLSWRDRLVRVGAAALVALVLLAPWVVRNLTTFDEPTFLAVGPGYVLEFANCDDTYSGPLLGYWSASCDATPWPDGDESVVGAHKLDIAVSYIGDHLADQPRVVAARVGRLWGVYRPIQTADFDVFFERRPRLAVDVALWWHWATLALAAAGAVILHRRGVTLVPALAFVVLATWTAAITFGITRYRIGADVALVVLAAVAVDHLLGRVTRPHDDPVGAIRADPRP